MRRSSVSQAASAAGLAAVLVAATTGFATQAQAAAPARSTLPGSAPNWLGRAKHLGATDRATRESLTVYLAPRGGEAALKAAVLGVSTPGSATYRHFLTSAAYFARYSPTTAETAAVTAWLQSTGLRVTGQDPHHRFLQVSGSAADAAAAFGTSLQTYSHDGQTVQAPSGALSVPGSVAGAVLGVTGLDTTQDIAKTQTTTSTTSTTAAQSSPAAAPPAAFANGRPCSLYYGQLSATVEADGTTPLPTFEGKRLPYTVCGYTGAQFRSAFEGTTKLTGAGVTVGVIDAYAAPTIASDAQEYALDHGDASYQPGQLSQTTFGPFNDQKACQGEAGWYGEETLDVEAVHAMAPAAGIHYYGAKNCEDGLTDASRAAVDADQVQIISNSYGDVDSNASSSYIAEVEQIFLQGAMEGISFTFSSGDDGDELATSGLKQTDYETSDPYVTAVGGTSTAIGKKGTLVGETGWGTEEYALNAAGTGWTLVDPVHGGAGGGYSTLFNRPSYQEGVVPDSAPAGRAVPDVAMDADPTTGLLVGETQTYPDGSHKYGEYRIGGTSVASPMFAGMTALLLQHAGGGLGLLNPVIYKQERQSKDTFTDVTTRFPDIANVRVDYNNGVDATAGVHYTVRTFDQDTSLRTTPGWDDVTGVGTPNAAWLTSIR